MSYLKCALVTSLFLSVAHLLCGVSTEVLAKYPNPTFIETGTYLGDSTTNALQAGFPQVYSVELSLKYYQKAQRLFKIKPNVKLVFGDSGTMLQKVIAPITTPVTFFLDAHWSGGDTAIAETVTPLLQELETIRRHPVKTHTILINSVHSFGEYFEGLTLDETIAKIKKINPNYVISYEDGVLPQDILVAKIL